MSTYFTDDKIKYVMKGYNDELHYRLEQTGDITLLVKHDLTDPRKFIIIKDNHYDGNKLEGKTLIFNDPEEFKQAFPEFSQPPPVHIPSNMKRNAQTGLIEGEHKDPYLVKEFKSYPADDINGLKLMADMGRDVDIGAIWIKFPFGSEKFTIALANDIEPVQFRFINGLKQISSQGTTDQFEPYNIDNIARYILLIVYDNPKLTDLDMINNIKVTKARAI